MISDRLKAEFRLSRIYFVEEGGYLLWSPDLFGCRAGYCGTELFIYCFSKSSRTKNPLITGPIVNLPSKRFWILSFIGGVPFIVVYRLFCAALVLAPSNTIFGHISSGSLQEPYSLFLRSSGKLGIRRFGWVVPSRRTSSCIRSSLCSYILPDGGRLLRT